MIGRSFYLKNRENASVPSPLAGEGWGEGAGGKVTKGSRKEGLIRSALVWTRCDEFDKLRVYQAISRVNFQMKKGLCPVEVIRQSRIGARQIVIYVTAHMIS